MYFVDRQKIEQTLQFYDRQLELLEKEASWETDVQKAALERICHTIIEAVLDVGNSMIDGFIMRDPGSFEDIVDILLDEKVITEEVEKSLKQIIGWRKQLVQNYMEVDHEGLSNTFQQHLKQIRPFSQMVRNYLETELGPVSAFKN
ncbi:DUF86 domain-containing protein [Aeribacillus pallidus]|jgi:uncharacterized protein YutE (UPF0331/DUF86 family)|uniref:DUF86 domain-containing protein n=1 Tax=Aeribacillus pallidus TaxID=33936 RepID=UPI001DEFE2F8|nr:DUF86 domain-containing protein [Bacillus sp. (in: firmicutes)]